MKLLRLSFAVCAFPLLLTGATIDSIWSGGATGNWSVAGNWTPNGVPNNGGDTYNVNIPMPAAVTVDGTFSIQIFDVDSGAMALMPAGFLTLNANSTLDGLLRIGLDGSFATARLALGTGVILSGAGTIELLGSTLIESAGAIGAGVTLQTGTSASQGATISGNLTSAGPININNPNFVVSSMSTLTSTGPLHLSANAILRSLGATAALQSNITQLDTGSEINGGVVLNAATVNGPGRIRPNLFNLFGTNTINAPIETDNSSIVINGNVILNGTGPLILKSTNPISAAAPGATLTTGTGFAINVTSDFPITLPTLLQGTTTVTGTMTVSSTLENDATINLNGSALMRVNANASIAAGSSGTINVGPSAMFEVFGPSTLGGTFAVSNDFRFRPGVTTVTGSWNGDATSEIILNTGTVTANFSQQVANVGKITVPNNGNLSFNAGLLNFGTATITGSTAVFGVTGNTTATGLFQIRSASTHRGAGTTTAQGALEFNGKLDGRTLIAQGATQGEQLILQNNALFVNEGTYSFFSFGPAATVTGSGIFRNSGTLTQVTNGFSEFIPTNTIVTPFEQTTTGNTTPVSTIQLIGNSTVAGAITIPEDAVMSFTAGTSNTTHAVGATISGQGKLEVKGNTGTGSTPTVNLNGQLNLVGANSGTTISNGASVSIAVSQADEPRLGQAVDITNSTATMQLAVIVSRLFGLRDLLLGDRATLEAVPPPSVQQQAVTVDTLSVAANPVQPTILKNLDLETADSCSVGGLLDLVNSTLTTGPACTAEFHDGAQIQSSTDDGSCENRGTWNIPEFAVVDVSADVVNSNGEIVNQAGAVLNVSGNIVSSTATLDVFPGGVTTCSGASTLLDTTITAHPGTGGDPGGRVVISNLAAAQNTTVRVKTNARAEIYRVAFDDDDDVTHLDTDIDDGLLFMNALINVGASVEIGQTGRLLIGRGAGPGGNGHVRIAPGASAGRLDVTATGTLAPGAGSQIVAEIGGLTQTTQYDLLAVTGVFDVSNTSLRPRFINNFQNSITPANTFTVVQTTQPITGSFFNVFGGKIMTQDGTGTFSVSLTNGNTHVVLGNFIPGDVIDSDSDGMSDEFEKEHFGDPIAGIPGDDNDGDGMTNLEEYKAGTNPIDPASLLQITEFRREGNNIVIVFEAAPDKSYRAEAGMNLSGAYPITVETIAATPTGGTRTVTHVGAASTPPLFYRVILLP